MNYSLQCSEECIAIANKLGKASQKIVQENQNNMEAGETNEIAGKIAAGLFGASQGAAHQVNAAVRYIIRSIVFLREQLLVIFCFKLVSQGTQLFSLASSKQ